MNTISRQPQLPEDIDPITFEVVRSSLDALVDEMAITVMRTAYSGIVKDSMDYSTVFCDEKGRVIAQGLTIVAHLNSFPDAVNCILEKYKDNIFPGDIFILNDPYGSGGIHLPDIFIIKPVFVDQVLEGFSGATAHHSDVGGLVPGSNSTDSTEIYQEGLRIPALKLYEKGIPREDLFDLISTNVRVPIKVIGDLRAEIAAVNLGERQYIGLAHKYGISKLRSCIEALIVYTEHLVRSEISALKNGRFDFTAYIDADNIEEGPVIVNLTLTVSGEKMIVDLHGSSPQVKAGINSPLTFTKSAVYRAVRMVMDPTIPNTSGYHHLIEVKAPPSSVVAGSHPAACGARGITGFRVSDAVMGALAQAAPDRVPADGDGGHTIISIGGYDSERIPFTYVDLIGGARGAHSNGDGPEGVPYPGGNISNTPVEIAEVELPIRIEEYSMLQDTGGPGEYRGSLSQTRRVRCLVEEAVLQIRSDKRRFRPYGLHGGHQGASSMNILNPGSDEAILPTMSVGEMVKDSVVLHKMASGGGWGNPLDRDPGMVRQDVWDEKVSFLHARETYGVIIDPITYVIDDDGTQALRLSYLKDDKGIT